MSCSCNFCILNLDYQTAVGLLCTESSDMKGSNLHGWNWTTSCASHSLEPLVSPEGWGSLHSSMVWHSRQKTPSQLHFASLVHLGIQAMIGCFTPGSHKKPHSAVRSLMCNYRPSQHRKKRLNLSPEGSRQKYFITQDFPQEICLRICPGG